jgi:hypothetical protein
MTPKDKAKDIWMKFFEKQIEVAGNGDGNLCVEMALIAVDEIIQAIRFTDAKSDLGYVGYWQQVKQEIQAL